MVFPCLVGNEASAQARCCYRVDPRTLESTWARPIANSNFLEARPAPAPAGVSDLPLSHSLMPPLLSHHSFVEISFTHHTIHH